jgi:hypothetical protein
MSVPDPDDARRDPFGEGAAAAKARRTRSLVIALALVGFVVLVFVVTMLKLGVNATHVVQQTS